MAEPAGAKKVRLAAEALGFTTQQRNYEFDTEPTLWASTANGHNEGDVRTPSKRVSAHRLVGYRVDARMGFEVEYAPGFKWAYIADPIGKPISLGADYSYGAMERKQFGYLDKYADDKESERSYLYNDGEQFLQKRYWINTSTEFFLWIDELLSLFGSDYPKISAKPRAPRKTKLEAINEAILFDGEDWVG